MIQNCIFLFAAVVPTLLFLGYYYKKDKQKPEPKRLVLKIYLLGFLSIPLAMLFAFPFSSLFVYLYNNMNLPTILIHIFRAFIIAGLCEETAKFVVIKTCAYRNRHFDEIMDGIVYAVAVSLGFACGENILYVFYNGGIPTAIIRALTAVPMHAACSGIMGYYLGMARFDKQNEKKLILIGITLAIFLHGLYDFFLFVTPLWSGMLFFAAIFVLLFCNRGLAHFIKQALIEDAKQGNS